MKYFILILFAIFFIPTSSALAADEGWVINSFDSQIIVKSDGVAVITENITVDFGLQQKHGIYRYIPYLYKNADGTTTYTEINNINVMLNDSISKFDKSTPNGNVMLKIGDGNKTISGVQQYKITYQAKGILRSFTDYDELYWNVTGNDWPVVINNINATVTLPTAGIVQSACYYGPTSSSSNCSTQDVSTQTVVFNQSTLGVGENMTLALGYTKGMVPIITIADPYALTKAGSLAMIIGFLATILFGTYFLMRKWWVLGRDRKYIKIPSNGIGGKEEPIPFGYNQSDAPEFAPPKGYRPAEIGIIIDEKVDTVDVTATIVDLAVRGYLTITEIEKKGIFKTAEYKLTKTNKDINDLLEYEKYLLNSLFSLGTKDGVTTADLKNKFYSNLNTLKDKLYARVIELELFTHNPAEVRTKYYAWGALATLLFPGLGVLAIYYLLLPVSILMGFAAGLTVGIFVVGILTLCVARAMAQRSAKGYELYRKALGYKLFVMTAEKYRQKFMEDQNIFMEILPYAMIFNVTEKLVKAFKDMGITPPQPNWYVGNGPFNLILFSSAMNSFSSSFSSTMASTPSSSGSGGGGFSGGGFGGGGGGSW
jgi:uncharacterized membrane protein